MKKRMEEIELRRHKSVKSTMASRTNDSESIVHNIYEY
jgi:hypothetical protein